MKDFDAMVLAVVRDRQRSGRAPRRPIRLVFTADEEAAGHYGAHYLVEKHPDTVADCTEAIGEVGGFSVTVRDDLRLYLIQTAEKGLAWLNLIASGTAGHGSMRTSDNAVTTLASAVSRIGNHKWPRACTPPSWVSCTPSRMPWGDRRGRLRGGNPGAPGHHRADGRRHHGQHRDPTMLRAGYKHNVIPGEAIAGLTDASSPAPRKSSSKRWPNYWVT